VCLDEGDSSLTVLTVVTTDLASLGHVCLSVIRR
jgi:hypothetical protein